jgi:hypothetical protein
MLLPPFRDMLNAKEGHDCWLSDFREVQVAATGDAGAAPP